MKFFDNITIIEYGLNGGTYYAVTDYKKSLFGSPSYSSFLKPNNKDAFHFDSYEEAVKAVESYLNFCKTLEENERKQKEAECSIRDRSAKVKQIFKL